MTGGRRKGTGSTSGGGGRESTFSSRERILTQERTRTESMNAEREKGRGGLLLYSLSLRLLRGENPHVTCTLRRHSTCARENVP